MVWGLNIGTASSSNHGAFEIEELKLEQQAEITILPFTQADSRADEDEEGCKGCRPAELVPAMAETMGLVCMAEAQAVIGFRAEAKGSLPGTVASLMVGASGEQAAIPLECVACSPTSSRAVSGQAAPGACAYRYQAAVAQSQECSFHT